jgi:hypothetical protein
MKRILKFQKSDEYYQVVDAEELLFSISIAEMKFDVKEFYYAFFGDTEKIGNIEIENTVSSDKVASRVYDCIVKLYGEIVDGFNKESISNKEGEVSL